MRCPNCENENRDQAKFCDECGFPLTGAIARAAIESLPDEQDEVLVETEEAVQELSIASDDAELSIEDTQRIDVASDDFENEEAPEKRLPKKLIPQRPTSLWSNLRKKMSLKSRRTLRA